MRPAQDTLDRLRARLRHIEEGARSPGGALAFGLPQIDSFLPQGGLSRGSLHAFEGGAEDLAAAATLFIAGIVARLDGPVLWCATRDDLYPPGLSSVGLSPDRLLYARAPDERMMLEIVEDGLRCSGLAAVVGELAALPSTPSRRLMLAARSSGTMALILRRSDKAAHHTPINGAVTQWRVTPLPSKPEAVGSLAIGPARWQVELLRCRGGEAKTWIVEACNAQDYLGVPSFLGCGTISPSNAIAA